MTQSVITSSFERLKAQEASGGNRIIIDQFVFANIPGLNVADTPPDSEPLPPDTQIVHRQGVDRTGMVNENTVAYSVTLPESAGDFTFNWMGLVSSTTNTLCMVVYLHPQEKIKTANGKQGNTLVYSQIMEYTGASATTGITTPVSTWQIDFTARLHGMDEATRKAALDIYGPGLFLDDAFKLTAQTTGQATFAPGIAYLRGLRVELDAPGTLTYPTGISQTVYIDAALTGTLTGENKATFSLTSQTSADYIDSLGFAHYVEPVATISAGGEITDIRKTRRPFSDRLDGEFLTRGGNLADVPDKALARQSLQLGNSATRNVGTTPNTVAAGDDARITGAVQKTGDTMTGKLTLPQTSGFGVNTDNVLGGSSVTFGDNDTGIKQNGDGILDFYANGQLVARIAPGVLYALNAVQAGDGKKLAVSSSNNSTLNAGFSLWGDGGNRPTVIELGDDQGWHLYSQRNSDGSIVFVVNGDITANTLRAGDTTYQNNGDIYGSVWGNNWLSISLNNQFVARDNNINTRATWDYVNQTFVRAVRLGPSTLSGGLWRDYQLGGGNVVTGFHTDGDWEMQGDDDRVYYRPVQYLVNGTWVTAASA
ncbi:hypothetical protein HT206_002458 [Salmonella enterica]|nr:hypothetical protein [Salmonella enterica]